MSLWGRSKSVLILILAPLFVYLGLLNLSDRASWKVPSDGLRFVQSSEGPMVSSTESPALPVGIEKGDLLVDINGLSIRSVDEYVEVIEALSQAGETEVVVDYTFRSAGGAEELVTYPIRIRRASQLSARDIPIIVVGIAFLIIGVFVYLRSGRAPGSFQFALICIVAYTLFLFRYSGRADAFDLAVYWLSEIAFLVLPPLFFHFCVAFPEESHSLRRKLPRMLILYIPAVLLLLLHVTWFFGELQSIGLPRTPVVGRFLDKLELIHFAGFLVLAGAVLARARLSSRSPVSRKQMQWISAGTLAGLLPFVALYVVPYLMDLRITAWMEASVLSLILVPLTFGYAITKFRLSDVELIFKRGVSYVLASSALLAFYVGLALLIAQAMQDFTPRSGFVLLALSALAVAVLFAPLREKIQERLDRYSYKERYSYRRSFLQFGRTLGSEINLDRLIEKISDRIQKTLDVAPIAVFLREEGSPNVFRLESGAGFTSLDRPMSIDLTPGAFAELELTSLESLEGGVPQVETSASQEVREKLYRWGIRYVEPLSVRGRIIGFLGLGRRRNGDFLSSEDLEMVESLSGYAAIAIDNAMLYSSLESKANELMQLRIYSDNVIESINLGVGVLSAQGTVTVWNSAMASLTGISRQEAVGNPAEEVLPSELVESVSRISDGPNFMVTDVRRLYKTHLKVDEHARLLNVTLSPFISYDNLNTGTLLVVDNVTEKTRLENQLQQAEKLSSIGLFAAGLAHEVNTPLAGISSYSQMLLQEVDPDSPHHPLLKKIEKQSFRASEIVNNLLNFARFSDSDFEEVNVNSLVTETLSLLEHQFRKGKIKVEMEFDSSLPETVGNGGKLQQVFMNLFLNARDSMSDGGTLSLKTYARNSELVVEVEDTGTGISQDDIKRIYDPFFTTKDVGKGTGLGLSVSYGIIQEHSGRISVDSKLGSGTKFSLYLPIKRVH